MRVPFVDLKPEYALLKGEIDREIHDVLDSGYFVLGEKVGGFEGEFADYLGVGHVVAVNSGTSALYLALRALNVGPGDEVITAANTFVATCEAIAMTGATPRLVDVIPSSHNMDPGKLRSAISSRTKVLIPVHLYGLPADMDEIIQVAGEFGLSVVEDAAQAHGAECVVSGRRRKAGTIGDLGCFSFYPSKNLGCYGEGGAVVTESDELAKRVVMLRDHGQEAKHLHAEVGGNFRMSAFQGAVLGVKLRKLDEFNRRRMELASIYSEALAESPLTLPGAHNGSTHVYHLYVVQTERRDELREHLSEEGIGTGIHYLYPVHLCDAFRYLGYEEGDFPVSEVLSRRVLSLPMYPYLKEEQVRLTAGITSEFLA
ncbi:MAG: DegT/DnrJ/EryC1/StrS family aminotransferase [bacterium]